MRFVVILCQQFLELSACQTNMQPVKGSNERTSFGLVTLSWNSQPDAGSESRSRKHYEELATHLHPRGTCSRETVDLPTFR